MVPARLEMKFHHWPRLGVFVVCDRIDIYCLPVVATQSTASAVSGRVSKVQDSYIHYGVLSHYVKYIFCENSDVRGFICLRSRPVSPNVVCQLVSMLKIVTE